MSRENNKRDVPPLPVAGRDIVAVTESDCLMVSRALDLNSALKHVARSHLKCLKAACDGLFFALEAGVTLLAAKERVEHGKWTQAIKRAIADNELPITVRTCQRYMKLAENLLNLPGAPPVDALYADRKTTRASFLQLFAKHDVDSISSALALGTKGRNTEEPEIVSETLEIVRPDAEPELITPPQVLECVLSLFGEIDLDPCAASNSNIYLPAKVSIGPTEDGLSFNREWPERVFVHPPADNVLPFIIRAVDAVESGEARKVLVFVPAVTDAPYMKPLQPFVKGFLCERPTFNTPDGELIQPVTAYMVVLVTLTVDSCEDFAEAFSKIADIYYPRRATGVLPHPCEEGAASC